jgi:hypothetical protein
MSMAAEHNLRWDPYFIKSGSNFDAFWKDYLLDGDHHLLYILGQGFDPRMCIGIEALLRAGGFGSRDCLLVDFDEGLNSPSKQLDHLAQQNRQRLDELINKRGNLISKQVKTWSSGGLNRHRISSYNAEKLFTDLSDFSGYTDVIVDISALPRAIYFSLIGKIIHLLDKQGQISVNLHVIVCEDTNLDGKIHHIGIDDTANYVHGFGGIMQTEATAETPKIWIPILGEGQKVQLERIYAFTEPDEICPILPHPSRDPRRADRLLVAYRDLLFDQWRVEPRNIVYASEQNPFDTYRKICQVVQGYDQALAPIGGCKAAISAQSSKLLSVGALLAAYELKENKRRVGIVHVEAQGYEIADMAMSPSGELFTLWIAGECYAI